MQYVVEQFLLHIHESFFSSEFYYMFDASIHIIFIVLMIHAQCIFDLSINASTCHLLHYNMMKLNLSSLDQLEY